MEKLMGLDQLREAIDLGYQAKEGKYYHNAKHLLKAYRSVMWCLENDIREAELDAEELGYEHIHQALDTLSCSLEDDTDLVSLQSQCKSMLFTHALILIVNKALLALKNYPDNGQEYFDIVNRVYILQYRYSETELLNSMNISRRTLYRDKKMALSLLGVILWGYMIPNILSGQDIMGLTPKWQKDGSNSAPICD